MTGTEASAVACVPDMITNILERVPDPVSLFRCSLVCKEWRDIVGDPAFLRRHGMASDSLVGIFVQRERPRKITELFPTLAPLIVSAPGSVLGPQLRPLTCFVRDDAGILDNAHPLAAGDGLLLVRVWRHRSSMDKNSAGRSLMRLCVCNLLTGKRDVLPAFDVDAAFDAYGTQGYAILTAADNGPRHDADGHSTLFQVLLVGRSRVHSRPCRTELRIRRFSSASGHWDALDCSQPNLLDQRPGGLWGPYGCRVATIAHGTAHWLFDARWPSFYTLDVSASTGQVSVTALPVDAVNTFYRSVGSHRPWFLCTTTEGRLALLGMEKTNNQLVMMKNQQQDDGDHWDSVVAEVHVDADLGFGRKSLYPICIGGRSGTVLARSRSDPELHVYVLDTDRRSSTVSSATKVDGWIQNFNTTPIAPFNLRSTGLSSSFHGLVSSSLARSIFFMQIAVSITTFASS